ncbi:LEAF RUST 10 DISEASE-RESISTANCE LOCUS RECEPTOR-LIKE PROTEIN KINASE-like 2.1 [Impatiens glandulifera]|uniref:LEAF RUST 10 DISEASE-RESISTANCE LOCUS RECEPTOR-LIKE PROTEIN KINASE-like 2.1 n=1 Tax=Impatiens glandulifera TaxID=253017 RepID=UPI001FB07991|nr:LEAF RUST 10 DISEASE-RESISTANCE LOCUS RECEPTOR-LIKE PROTEIN KINASE-like 2.1 [Impatiens glandulifera]
MNHTCFSAILIVLSLLISKSNAQNQQYDTCGELLQCGNIADLGYPFWGGNRPEFCGLPAFNLNCTATDSQPRITINSHDYHVLAINNESWSITVIRNEFFDDVCPENPGNATLDTSFFNYAADITNFTLFYGCRTTIPSNQVLNSFDCEGSDNTIFTNNSYLPTSLMPNLEALEALVGVCSYSIDVQVNKTSGDALKSSPPTIELKAALENGFGLVWSANNTACERCVGSNGRCGSNSSSFVCHCIDRDYAETCGNMGEQTLG